MPAVAEQSTADEPGRPTHAASNQERTGAEISRLRSAAQQARRAGEGGLAARLFGQACELDDARSCLRLAELLDEGRGVPPEPERAKELYQTACAAGLSEACDALGH